MASIFDQNNRLFVLAQQGRRRSSVPAAIAIVFVVMAFGLIPGHVRSVVDVSQLAPGAL